MKTTKLEKIHACSDVIEWVKTQKNYIKAWQNCERGDWLLWLAKRLDVDDRKLTLAKATCVNQVRHLMTDQRSLDALDACFRYAKGEISREELTTYAAAAYSAAYDYAAAAYSAAVYYADADADADAAAAGDAADAAYAAAAAAYAAAAAADDAYAASSRKESLKKSADICREILTEEVLKKYKNAKIK